VNVSQLKLRSEKFDDDDNDGDDDDGNNNNKCNMRDNCVYRIHWKLHKRENCTCKIYCI
jgi:hypothetical protein